VSIDWAKKLRVTSQRTVGLLHKFLLATVTVTVPPFNPSDNIAPDKHIFESTTTNIHEFRSS